ncbi:MAG: NAD(P)-binding domain-containing protein [Hyphomicrobiaceae bacterium]|nr:NAD(P)-binding domain-containing protein [Hyphomicrobiaceae bacterium]
MPEPIAALWDAGWAALGPLATLADWDQLANIANPNSYAFYFSFMAIAIGGYWVVQARGVRRSRAVKSAAEEAGMSEPPSLHPVIDPAKCIGCGACVNACPEGKVLGLINEKAELIEPASCIGHGACKTACPADAIGLVFGTATRGVDIPHVTPRFESNVPGLFIAGELGGMGLIANAIEQGRQAVEAIARLDGVGGWPLDLIIVGAGPAGISASLAAREKGLRTITIEQESFGGTVAHYPRGKIVMTRSATLPLFGKVRFRKVRKEKLLDLWARVVHDHQLPISYGERVESVVPWRGGFTVTTSHRQYTARAVLLANGRRGTPRKLGVPGEESPKVVYRLTDATQFRGMTVLVIGGGDSALEAASMLAAEGARVTLSYRGEAFTRARPALRDRIAQAVARGRLQLLMGSTITAIHPHSVDLVWSGRPMGLANQMVIVCIGGVLPGEFLQNIGVEVETKFGTA